MFRSNFDNFSGPEHHWRSHCWKPDPDDYLWHPKHTNIVCGSVSIVSRQYGCKLIRSNFDDFFRDSVPPEQGNLKIKPVWLGSAPKTYPHYSGHTSYHFQSSAAEKCFGRILITFSSPGTTGEIRVENRACMTRFSARNIPTIFWVQFFSFPINTAKICFDWILTTFPCLRITGAGKVKNRARMTRFWNLKHTHPIWDALLVVSHPYVKKWSRTNFHDFFGPGHHCSKKSWKQGEMTRFSTPNIPHLLGCNSYRFQSVWQKIVSTEFWRLFRARSPLV